MPSLSVFVMKTKPLFHNQWNIKREDFIVSESRCIMSSAALELSWLQLSGYRFC